MLFRTRTGIALGTWFNLALQYDLNMKMTIFCQSIYSINMLFPLPQGAGSTVSCERIDSNTSIRLIMGGGNGKTTFGKTNG